MTDFIALGLKLWRLRDELSRGAQLLEPALAELQKVLPELLPIARTVLQEAGVNFQDSTIASFDAFWLQRSLNQLGANLKVDGDLGPETQKAVKEFQTKHLIVPDDGQPNLTTCIMVFNELSKAKRFVEG